MEHADDRTLFTGSSPSRWRCCAGVAHAQATPVGLWKTIDDKTKKAKSLIRISETGGVLNGKLEKLLDQGRQARRDLRRVHRRPQGQADASA